ncbi:MAG TPA: amidohydrolase family protein [Candidatus Binataceae bacterium]|nr:amidohydrolase family protein [Candidatus Binataceae bacterium]
MPHSFKYVSADSHVVEPPDLWLKRIDRRYLDRAPRVVREQNGDTFVCADADMGRMGIGTSATAEKKSQDIALDNERWENVLPGSYDPFARIKDMDRDGVEAELLYTTFGLILFAIKDQDFQFACFRAFNDWLANFCASFPNRLFGAAMIPTEPLEHAVKEMERCAKMGLKAAMISISQDTDRGYNHPLYDPIWSASEDLAMPISLHVAASKKNFTFTNNMLADFSLAYTLTMYSIAAMIFSGVFDRHRKLKVVSVENDAAWAAGMLERMDYRLERDQGWAGYSNGITSGRSPSNIFHEHVYCTFMRDRTAVFNRGIIGVRNLMWGSDYPHFDSTWPHSSAVLDEHFAGVAQDDQLMIARRNAIELYHLPLAP